MVSGDLSLNGERDVLASTDGWDERVDDNTDTVVTFGDGSTRVLRVATGDFANTSISLIAKERLRLRRTELQGIHTRRIRIRGCRLRR